MTDKPLSDADLFENEKWFEFRLGTGGPGQGDVNHVGLNLCAALRLARRALRDVYKESDDPLLHRMAAGDPNPKRREGATLVLHALGLEVWR